MGKLDQRYVPITVEEALDAENKLRATLEEVMKDAPKGKIKITKLTSNLNLHISEGESRTGYCYGLKEGYGCFLENPRDWFHTSVVKSIDWKKKEFYTLNSTYSFEFLDGE